MRGRRGLSKRVVALVLVVVVVGGVVVAGALGFDGYAARKVVGVIQHYVEPTIEFDSFEFEAFDELRLSGVRFVADDGDGGEVDVVSVDELMVRLGAIPRPFSPAVIEEIALTDPEVHLIQYETEDGGMGFRGLVPFVKRDRVANQEDQPSDKKLSNVLRLERIAMTNGGVRYESGDGPPMVFRGLELDADITKEESADGTELHAVLLEFGEEPLLDVVFDGKLNIDTFEVIVDSFRLEADLTSERGISALPPQVQTLLGESEATGVLTVTAEGVVRGRDPLGSTLEANVVGEGIKAAYDKYVIPVERLEVPAVLEDGVATIEEMTVETLGGRVSVSGVEAELREPGMPVRAAWYVTNVELERALRAAASGGGNGGGGDGDDSGGGGGGGMKGLVESSGAVVLGAASPMSTMDGAGTLELRNGRLVAIPVLSDLFSAADVIGTLRGEPTASDELDASFRMRPRGIVFDDLSVSVPVAKFRGTGVFAWGGELDFQMRGGAVEAVPLIGEALGNVTGRLARYDIEGTAAEPKISVSMGGDRELDEGEDAETAAEGQERADREAAEEASEAEAETETVEEE